MYKFILINSISTILKSKMVPIYTAKFFSDEFNLILKTLSTTHSVWYQIHSQILMK